MRHFGMVVEILFFENKKEQPNMNTHIHNNTRLIFYRPTKKVKIPP